MLTVTESASYLGRSAKTVRRYIKQGLLPCERVNGKFGPEIRIARKSLDTLVKRLSSASKRSDDPFEILRLYRKASPEIKELVRKILKSTPVEDGKDERSVFLRPFFWKKGGEKT